ncbi:MAG: MarR family transcriptional regulator [Thermodesulfobacteriota bacterium]|nr:MarR family transcriptional regulator [Thermodesulfobacteriota bacterium]
MKKISKVFPLDNSPGYIINSLAREMNVCLYRSFREKGFEITAQQWAVLNRLWEMEGLHQSKLAQKTTKNRHNMTMIIKQLEVKGFIEKRSDTQDKRLQRVYLTKRGKDLRKKLIPIAIDTIEKLFRGVNPKDMVAIRRIHKTITHNLKTI